MTYSLDPAIEEVLCSEILIDLVRGRKNFDKEHTEAVVYWMKWLLDVVGTTSSQYKVLVTAAYAHDWGYVGLFDGIDSSNIDVIHKMKPLHMERGAKLIADLIARRLKTHFTVAEVDRIAHLVSVHDKVEDLHDEDEILLMEADTMGMLDVDRVKPTFTKADNALFMKREIYDRRLTHFVHRPAIVLAQQLAAKRIHFYT